MPRSKKRRRQSVFWRPVASDAAEGAGNRVENMVSGARSGSALVAFLRRNDDGTETKPTDIQGRYFEVTSSGATYSYLLPQGF